MSKTLILENVTVVPDPLQGEFYESAAVVIQDGTILAVESSATAAAETYPGDEVLDGGGMLLLPGLIDAHTHLYAALTTGMPATGEPPQNFPHVLKDMWWKWDNVLTPEDVAISALAGSLASLHGGTTTMIDHLACPRVIRDSLSVEEEAIDQVGLRACLAYEVSDRHGAVNGRAGIAENRRFILANRKREDHRVRALFGLHAVYSLSEDTLERCAGEGRDLETGFHMHMAEHPAEVYKFAESHHESIPAYLAQIGILGPQTVLAHTVQIGAEEIAILKETGTFNVHNPHSNAGNGVGVARLAKMFEMGQPVGLGSDGFYDLPFEMELARLLQTLDNHNPSAFSGAQVLQMIYGHNARFAERIFDVNLGKVEPGYAADLILLDYHPSTPLHAGNLGSHILAALQAGAVRTVLVGGEVVLLDGAATGVDEAEVRAQSLAAAERIWQRL